MRIELSAGRVLMRSVERRIAGGFVPMPPGYGPVERNMVLRDPVALKAAVRRAHRQRRAIERASGMED